MSIQTLKDRLPEYAKDLKLNLSTLVADSTLTEAQKAGTFIATAIACRNPEVIRAITSEFAGRLDSAACTAARAAAAIMGMNNVYYRFLHLTGNEEYSRLPAKLRMNVIANPGTAREDFELWCLAVSAVNACGKCVDAHEKVLRSANVTAAQVQTAVRIAAVVHAVAVTLEAEEAEGERLQAAA